MLNKAIMCLNPLGKGAVCMLLHTISSHRRQVRMLVPPVRLWERAFAGHLWSHHCPWEQVPGVTPCSSRCQVISLQVPSLSLRKNPAWALLIVQRLKTSQDPLKATCCLTDRKRCAKERVLQRRWECLGLQTYSKASLFSSSLKIPGEFWGSNIWLCVQRVLCSRFPPT